MPVKSLRKNGREYVILPRNEYDALRRRADQTDVPPLPKPDADGNYPAVEYARASLARKIIRDRVSAGMTQKELAQRAGVRVETLCRIETGKHTPSVPTVAKLDRALQLAHSRDKKRQSATVPKRSRK